MKDEIWKDIPRYEGLYQASPSGNIKEILDKLKPLLDYITNLQQELEKTRLENKLLKEQMVAMVQPTYTYGISGGSSE